MPQRAFGAGHELHEVVVGVPAGVLAILGPDHVQRLAVTPKLPLESSTSSAFS